MVLRDIFSAFLCKFDPNEHARTLLTRSNSKINSQGDQP